MAVPESARSSGPLDVWVAPAFSAKRTLRPMSRNEHGVVAHGPQALDDAHDECVEIAAWKVSSADAPREQDITDERDLRIGIVEHHMARRVSRAVPDVQSAIADLDRLPVVQPLRRRERFNLGEPKHLRLLHQTVYPELIVGVRPDDWQAQVLGKGRSTSSVINVGVCDDDLFDLEVMFADQRENFFNVVAGVNHHRLAGLLVAHDGAIALQRADGKNLVDHNFKLTRPAGSRTRREMRFVLRIEVR